MPWAGKSDRRIPGFRSDRKVAFSMELMQLEMFVAVVEECSVRRAAERVFRTQPAVSIALRKLKQEIGLPLLDDTRRSNRKLTEAGRILYGYASMILGMRNEALALLREDRSSANRVSIGVQAGNNLKRTSQITPIFSAQRQSSRVFASSDTAIKSTIKLRAEKSQRPNLPSCRTSKKNAMQMQIAT
jgi:DNA-binding transcriptional LysR family regulator